MKKLGIIAAGVFIVMSMFATSVSAASAQSHPAAAAQSVKPTVTVTTDQPFSFKTRSVCSHYDVATALAANHSYDLAYATPKGTLILYRFVLPLTDGSGAVTSPMFNYPGSLQIADGDYSIWVVEHGTTVIVAKTSQTVDCSRVTL